MVAVMALVVVVVTIVAVAVAAAVAVAVAVAVAKWGSLCTCGLILLKEASIWASNYSVVLGIGVLRMVVSICSLFMTIKAPGSL